MSLCECRFYLSVVSSAGLEGLDSSPAILKEGAMLNPVAKFVDRVRAGLKLTLLASKGIKEIHVQ